jgi:hypothetical protein
LRDGRSAAKADPAESANAIALTVTRNLFMAKLLLSLILDRRTRRNVPND